MGRKGCRILLVENSEKGHEVFEQFVKEKGIPYDFVNAGSLAEAKQACTLYRDIVEATHTLIWRTDAEGRARLVLPHADVWLLSVVHMIPAPAGAKADWESFWASLSFETADRR